MEFKWTCYLVAQWIKAWMQTFFAATHLNVLFYCRIYIFHTYIHTYIHTEHKAFSAKNIWLRKNFLFILQWKQYQSLVHFESFFYWKPFYIENFWLFWCQCRHHAVCMPKLPYFLWISYGILFLPSFVSLFMNVNLSRKI